jgi:transposase-like protein
VKERAVQLVLTTIKQQNGERHGVVSRIDRQLDIGAETLRTWVRQAACLALGRVFALPVLTADYRWTKIPGIGETVQCIRLARVEPVTLIVRPRAETRPTPPAIPAPRDPAAEGA